MMMKFTLTFLFALACSAGFAQGDKNSVPEIIEMKRQLARASNDTSRVLQMADISYNYAYTDKDSSFLYGQMALKKAGAINFTRGRANALAGLGNCFVRQGDYPKALQYQLQALQLSEENHFEREKAISMLELGYTYQALSDNAKSFDFYKRAEKIFEKIASPGDFAQENKIGLSSQYIIANKKDSALTLLLKQYNDPKAQSLRYVTLHSLCDLYINFGNYPAALQSFHRAVVLDQVKNDLYALAWTYNSGAVLFQKTGQADSCIYYAKTALLLAQKIKSKEVILNSSLILSKQYESINTNEAFYYRKIYDDVYQQLYGQAKVLELQNTLATEQEHQRQIENARVAEENKRKQYYFLGGLAILAVIVFLLYRVNVQQRKAKETVEGKNKVIEQALSDLKSAQTQLIQTEKMASLGELTAGIAHEIQNPLNFVNNFSEVNQEMLEELKTESKKPKAERDEQLEIELLNDLIENEGKINHHGRRADSIVKGMLEHSRSVSGQKEPTDINQLADEYLRLSYHGLRAKDKGFNAELVTHFDPTLPKVNAIPQDIGRVLLNLFNNAFYAVNQKQKLPGADYKPEVSVTTSAENGSIIIKVKDNGVGIPDAIKEKIMQPFFTTKPTGEGTGLGLSLTYDMVVKGHGGKLTVDTKEGEGSEFTIALPLS